MMEQVFDYHKNPLPVEEIAELFELAFKRKFDEAYWHWRFKENPIEDKLYISYTKDGNTLTGYYAVSPLKMLVHGEQTKVALSMMTMTHPEHQGKGIFKKLATQVYNNLKTDGYDGVYGFANVNSHYGFRKNLGWKDLCMMYDLSLEREHQEIGKITHQPLLVSDLDSIEAKDSPIQIAKSPAYLKWRLIDNPDNDYYKFLSSDGTLIVYKLYDQDIDIVDYFGKESNFLNAMREFLDGFPVKKINTWCNLHSRRHLLLEKLRFRPANFNSYFGFINFNGDRRYEQFSNWAISMIDSDIF